MTSDVQCNPTKRVLLVDPDEAFAATLRKVLGQDYTLESVARIKEATSILYAGDTDIVLLNWDQPSGTDHADSIALIREARDLNEAFPILVFSWDKSRGSAIEAIRQGASDYFEQPLDVLTLKFALDRAYHGLMMSRDLAAAEKCICARRVEGLIGNSKRMEHIYEMIHKVGSVLTTVLITGESGTGKEVAARAIHRLSPRARKPFVAFSVSALPESLIEDELFGHERGAFTSASHSRRGRFEEAQGGTIFLDEVGDLALPSQAKLLRVLQERTFERLGSNLPIPLDIRVICATNRNLEQMVRAGTFRQDLYFRISVLKIEMPPLRNRTDDIPALAEYFLRLFASAHGKHIRRVSMAFLNALVSHSWPGNVRELQNVMERSVVLADGTQLGIEDLPVELNGLVAAVDAPQGTFQNAVRAFKREMVRSALRLCNGNKLKAAQELQISRCYLHRLLNQLNIEDESRLDNELASLDESETSIEGNCGDVWQETVRN